MAFAQTDGITVSASKTVELPPDETTFQIGVQAESDVGLDKVLEVLQPLGIAAKDLVSISSQQFGPGPNQTRLMYQFSFTAPFAKFKETQEGISSTWRSVLAANMDLQTFGIQVASGEAAREAARQRLLPELLADARKKADALAKIAGATTGKILGMGEFAALGGSFAGSFGGFFGPSSLRVTFQLSVRYALQ